jgi:SpoIID/LytB domain protein
VRAVWLAALVLGAPAAAVTVRVALTHDAPTVRLVGPTRFTRPDGSQGLALAGTVRPAADGLSLDDAPLAAGTRLAAADGGPLALALGGEPPRHCRGVCRLSLSASRQILVVNELDLEAYVQGVVPLEIGPKAPPAALAAQAVAARTYALFKRGDGTRADYDFDVAGTQNYRGCDPETPAVNAAVASVAGQVLRIDGQLLDAVYSTCCGGVTASAAEAWGTPAKGLTTLADRDGGPPVLDPTGLQAFLHTTADAWCRGDAMYRWRRAVPRADLLARATAWLARSHGAGRVTDLSVGARGPGGRVDVLLLKGDQGQTEVRGDRLRWVFGDGDQALPSTLFLLEGDASQCQICGGGHGHGVGLCQAGALAMAAAGRDAAAILRHYYPGAVLGS